MRLPVLAVVLVSLWLPLFSVTGVDAQNRRRAGARRPATAATPQRPAATPATSPQTSQPKPQAGRLTPLRTSDTSAGSRVTITSDTPLNDYSAYRSGDRYYVVLPRADANAVRSGAKGRGFEDAQVQKRGSDVVLSFRLQPGASARVNQRFNQLHVDIAAPGASAATTASSAGQTNQNRPVQRPTDARNQPATNERQTERQTASQQNSSVNSARPTGNTQAVNIEQTESSQPSTVDEQASAAPPLLSATPETLPTPAATPDATATEQVAQLQQPAAAPPSAIASQPRADAGQAGANSFGTLVLQNWPLALIATLLLVGLGLFFVTRRTSAAQAPTPSSKSSSARTALKEPRFSKGTLATPASTAAAAATGAAAAEVVTSKVSKSSKPSAAPVAERVTTPLVAPEATPKKSVETVESVAPVSLVEPEAVTAEAAAVVSAAEPAAVEPAAASKEIAPLPPEFEAERVQYETRSLLEGQSYDEAVLNLSDIGMRELVSAELLAALAGRNIERHTRARGAFIKHGYFDDAARNLQAAEAPAERASAARSLGLVGDRAATPHLVAALADTATEVRRASVEALENIKDPAAVEALEHLRESEKEQRHKIPRMLIQRAIDSCAAAPATLPQPVPVATAAEVVAPEVALTPVESDETPTLVSSKAPASPTPEPAAPLMETGIVLAGEAAEPSASTETISAPASMMDATLDASPVESTAQVDETTAPGAPAGEGWLVAVGETSETETALAAPETGVDVWTDERSETDAHETVQAAEAESTTAIELAPEPDSRERVRPEAPPRLIDVREFEDFQSELLSEEREADAAARDEKGIVPVIESDLAAADVPLQFDADVHEIEAAPAAPEQDVAEKGIEVLSDTKEFGITAGQKTVRGAQAANDWIELDINGPEVAAETAQEEEAGSTKAIEPVGSEQPSPSWVDEAKQLETFALKGQGVELQEEAAAEVAPDTEVETPAAEEKGVEAYSTVPAAIQERLSSEEPEDRRVAITELARLDTDESFHQICTAFDDPSPDVRNEAARALYNAEENRADSFTRALREASASRRRSIGEAIASSGLAAEAISQLTGASRDRTYDAFSLLFLMAKAGEVQPLIRAIESHADNEVRLAVVKLLALSGQQEILPAFRRLAVRGSLPTEVRSAVMEAIYQISSQPTSSDTPTRVG